MLPNKSNPPAEQQRRVASARSPQTCDDLHPMRHIYKNGQINGVQLRSPFVPASEDPSITGVATRDVVVDPEIGVAARLFLPTGAVATGRRLPLVLFFHGGFLLSAESAFCHTYHRYATSLAARARALVLSVDYRLVPEHHPMTSAYDDAWTALRWAAEFGDPWLLYHANRRCIFLAGDGAGGGSIAYHTAVRASQAGEDIDVKGVVLVNPHFWEPDWLPSEKVEHGGSLRPRLVAEIVSLPRRRSLVALLSMSGSWRGGKVIIVDLHSEERHGLHLYGTVGTASAARAEKLMESIVEVVNKKGPMLDDKNDVSNGVMDCGEDVAPSLSNGPCKAVKVQVPRRAVTKRAACRL